MKVLHTADWHLGHTLHDQNRDAEQGAFLGWMIETIGAEEADALLVCGDIFDTSNPPASAQALWYGFLAEARRLFPRLDIVAVGGNHDSAARLDAPHPLLEGLGVRVVGGLPRSADGRVRWGRLAVPLTDRSGQVAGWVAAVPYLRPGDIPPAREGDDPLVEGVRQVYARAAEEVRGLCREGQALLVTGHCYAAGGALSELSERKILSGNQHALPAGLFPPDAAYVALGHLHLAQRVRGDDRIRYSGAPLPLSLPEVLYSNQVCAAEFEGGRLAGVRVVRVPRPVGMIRVPARDALPLEDAVAQLKTLDLDASLPFEMRPYLEVAVRLDRPDPGLRRALDEALDGRPARLVKITPFYPSGEADPYSGPVGGSLGDLLPEDVFRRMYHDSFQSDPAPEILAAFHDLVQEASQGAS